MRDIVLPASTYYEIESYMVYDSALQDTGALVEPVGEARYDFFILAELARRLGYGHLYPQTEEELLSYALSGLRVYPTAGKGGGGDGAFHEHGDDAVQEVGKGPASVGRHPGFDTPSGKFEIASILLEEYGYDPLPRYIEPQESPLPGPTCQGVSAGLQFRARVMTRPPHVAPVHSRA